MTVTDRCELVRGVLESHPDLPFLERMALVEAALRKVAPLTDKITRALRRARGAR